MKDWLGCNVGTLVCSFKDKIFPDKKVIFHKYIPQINFGGEETNHFAYGDNDKYVKAQASDDEGALRCETLSEGALCKEGMWQVSLLSQVFATIIAIINSEPIL